MTHTHVNYEDVEPAAGAMYFLRDELDCEQLGFTVVECDADWDGKPHDHADEGHEEVYYLIEGSATITVDGDDVSMAPGDALRIDPDAERQLHSDDESTFVITGAP